ncbi:hypothetical protein [Knoellia subterranea]|uniref:Uncharacterized protein n=1 Tax=Knoellia subterranea KCTC 19937 TaxID=1385521 RepID=A0A0A0JJ76_9MICO|nr:hypothetical protein [Knoellia subterranea]KGN36829.1 hypothetical protein N803_16860 [Knoellia subterranea KCTC 19937]
MKKTLARGVAIAAVVAGGVAAAAPAQANTFTTSFRHGAVKYVDGEDKICVSGSGGYAATVVVSPVNGVGPTVRVTDAAGGRTWTCKDGLKYAYEDSRYRFRATSYMGQIAGGAASGYFWS